MQKTQKQTKNVFQKEGIIQEIMWIKNRDSTFECLCALCIMYFNFNIIFKVSTISLFPKYRLCSPLLPIDSFLSLESQFSPALSSSSNPARPSESESEQQL